MQRFLTASILVLAAAIGAGGALLYPLLFPKPPAPLFTLWRVFPLGNTVPLAACKLGFQQAFLNAKFTPAQIAIEPGEGIQVRAQSDGFSAVGLCMYLRGAALVVISGTDPAAIDERIQLVTRVAMPPAQPQPPSTQQPVTPQQPR